ncbi:MAG: putative peptidoglycan glycosyltransferase FtsW [Candidatus Latescibacterota bacterium]
MRGQQSIDFWLFIPAFILAALGIVMVYSSSMYFAMDENGSSSYFIRKQALSLVISFIAMLVCTRLNYRGYSKIGKYLLIFGYILLLGLLAQRVFHWVHSGHWEVYRWFRFGFLSFQPSEVVKLILVIYLAGTIASMGERIRDFKNGFIWVVGVVMLTFMLIFLEPSLSMASLSLIVGFYILFIGRAKLSHILLCFVPAMPVIVYLVFTKEYMMDRIAGYINKDPSAWSQVGQSIIGIGNGGFLGVGLGNSVQKYYFLPERHTDFIFSILGEELGFAGTSLVLILTLIFVWRGFKIAKEAPDTFGFLLASGLSFMIGIQVFINIGVAIGLLPTTGVTLPFISYGGSSLLLSFVATGILLNISKQGNMEQRLSREYGTRIQKRFSS